MKLLGVCSSTNFARIELTSSTSVATRGEGGRFRAGVGSACNPSFRATAVLPREGATPAGFSRSWERLMKSRTAVNESSLSSSTG